ncbi:peroxiredoxin [candidate division WOR_3 bacterium SM23_60]|uniref:thioredoxin-dependent peroxiredoxin n=1 Tax=candidate division WOR_3 bacterium SM23_60 TaxID=1703780 RepID=A0A0S8G2E1_UNCW3|nr:MAG: peroxiredoxin [candidate division WOR_3 bacterium SM23_60]
MAITLKISKKAPAFCLPDKDEKKVCLNDFKGKWVVLYFYPKDNTSGCTKEAVDFTAHLKDFKKMDAVIIGISPDSTNSHANFAAKHNLKVILLSDPEHTVIKKYGVWQKKRLYGREYYGVVRTTYIINPEGKITNVWDKVKVNGHATEVKTTLGESCRRM